MCTPTGMCVCQQTQVINPADKKVEFQEKNRVGLCLVFAHVIGKWVEYQRNEG